MILVIYPRKPDRFSENDEYIVIADDFWTTCQSYVKAVSIVVPMK